MEFMQVSTDILTTTIDINGIFNMVRDMFYIRPGPTTRTWSRSSNTLKR